MKAEKLTSIIKSVVFSIVYLLIYMLSCNVIGALMWQPPENGLNGIVILNRVLNIAVAFLMYIFIFKIRKLNLFSFCKFKAALDLKSLLLSISIGISISVFILCFLEINYLQPYLVGVKGFFNQFNNENVFYQMIFNITIFALSEEILFRGLIFNELRKTLPTIVALVIQALPAILQPDSVVGAFGFASMIICCYVYICFNSIWGSFTVLYASHLFVMLAGRLGMNTWLSGLGNSILIFGIGGSMLITAGLLAYIWKNYKYNNKHKYWENNSFFHN